MSFMSQVAKKDCKVSRMFIDDQKRTSTRNVLSYVDMSGDRISAAIPTLGSVYKLKASTKSLGE